MDLDRTLLLILFFTALLSCKENSSTRQGTDIDYSKFESGLTLKSDADSLDHGHSIQERLEYHKVPGASVAIFENGEMVWSKEYGVLKSGTRTKVNATSQFQAASISKAVAALGVLKMVAQYELNLDEDVNRYLKSWQVDYSTYPDQEKVTLRRLLSHSSGINVPGYYGYFQSDTLPSTLQNLNGKGKSPRVALDTVPGATFLYSGGGYTILEQVIEDVTDQSFAGYIQKEIFDPLEMANSSYAPKSEDNFSYAHDTQGEVNPEGWLIYPELAAAGLWTTPTDLVKFCTAIENSFHNTSNTIIPAGLAKEMLQPTIEWQGGNWWGLGVAVKGDMDDVFYWHSGSNPGGYRCMMTDFYEQRNGIIVMTNSDNGAALYGEIIDSYFNFKGIEF